MLLSTIAEVMIQLHFFLMKLTHARDLHAQTIVYETVHEYSLYYIRGLGGGSKKKTNYISYIMVERHIYKYVYV